ncbi:MAG: glycoside hydrolase family 127 protein [Planctomycetota bacterium]|nr:glycoside hydrolase family 127 protein [Planctomycetota bacterium]
MKQRLPILRLAILPILSLGCMALALPADAMESDRPLEPVRFQRVKINGFWKQQIKLQIEKWIPHCVRQMEQGGAGQELLNLIQTGQALRGEPVGEYRGAPWSDAYIYNTVEAICLALEVDPDGDAQLAAAQETLRAKLEEWIPIILAAQDKDGYIHSFHTLKKRPRFTAIGDHEFYVMGYLVEVGVAHYRMTGGKDRRLYGAATRCADLLCETFGPAPKRTWKNGHPGLEYALCRLGVLANDAAGIGQGDKYIALAKHFLDHQHEIHPDVYNQSDKPAVQMTQAAGHAVRATYFYTAMADLALLKGDAAYGAAADRIWANAIHKKHYLTGGVGAAHHGEAFADDYELPNSGYCESCAGCGLSFWAERMHRLHANAHFCDVQERVLYNNVLGAVERSGTNFFYQNPLVSRLARYPWHGCPCCVGNIPRTLIAIKDLMYSINAKRDTLYVNHFVDSDSEIADVGGAALRIRQETRYPWDGDVNVTINPVAPAAFTLALRIPDRTESHLYRVTPDSGAKFSANVNGQAYVADLEDGYVRIRRTWQAGDHVTLSLPMEVQRVRCDEQVVANRGRVAVQRGPIVYNFEDVDREKPVRVAVLAADVELKPAWRAELLGGVVAVEGGGLVGVPNYVRLNRGGTSQVWMIENREKVGLNTLASQADVTVSFCRDGMDPSTVNDSVAPGDGKDRSTNNFDFWPHKGTGEWIQYQFVKPAEVKACTIWWFDDTGHGECRIPASWRIVYRTADGEWKPVEGVKSYPVAKDAPVTVTFTPVTTAAIRLEIQLSPGFSSGVYEWDVR